MVSIGVINDNVISRRNICLSSGMNLEYYDSWCSFTVLGFGIKIGW